MLESCVELAGRLRPCQPLAWILAGLALATLAIGVFVTPGPLGQTLSLAGITTLLWCLIFTAFLQAFSAPLPQAGPQTGWWQRLRIRWQRLYRACLAIMLAGLLLALLWFTGRTLLLVLRG